MKRNLLIIAGSMATCALLTFLLLPLIAFSPTLNSGLLGQAVKRAGDSLVAQADSLSFRVNPWRNRVYIQSEGLSLQATSWRFTAEQLSADLRLTAVFSRNWMPSDLAAQGFDLTFSGSGIASSQSNPQRPAPTDLALTSLPSLHLTQGFVRIERSASQGDDADNRGTEPLTLAVERIYAPDEPGAAIDLLLRPHSSKARENTEQALGLRLGRDTRGRINRIALDAQDVMPTQLQPFAQLLDARLNLSMLGQSVSAEAAIDRVDGAWQGEVEVLGEGLRLAAASQADGRWQIDADIERPHSLASLHPSLSDLEKVYLPLYLQGQLNPANEASQEPFAAQFTLQATQSGVLAFDSIGLPPFGVRDLSATVLVDAERLRVEQIAFTTGSDGEAGPSLSGRLEIGYPRPGQPLTLELDLASPLLHAEDLFYLWPGNLAVQARAQADKHLLGGIIRDATLSLALEARPKGEPWVMERFHHHAHLEAARVLTHAPLGPLSDVSGHLEIDGRVLRVEVSEAQLENLLLRDGQASINYESPGETLIATQFAYQGEAEGALTRLIDGDLGLEFIRASNLEPLSGQVEGSVALDFALLHGEAGTTLPADRFRWAVQLASDSLRHADLFGFGEAGLSSLALDIDQDRLTGTAEASFATGGDTQLRFAQDLAAGETLIVEGEARVSDAWLRPYLTGFANWLEGEATADLRLEIAPRSASHQIQIDAALDDMALRLPLRVYEKPQGVPARLTLDAQFNKDGLQSIASAQLSGSDFGAAFSAQFDAGRFASAQLRDLDFGATQVPVLDVEADPNLITLTAQGGTLDLRPLMDSPGTLFQDDSQQSDIPDILVLASPLSRVWIEGDRGYLDQLRGTLRFSAEGLENAVVEAKLPTDIEPSFTFSLLKENDIYRLNAHSRNAGAALAAFGVSKTVYNGRLRLSGESIYPLGAGPWMMRLNVDEFRVREAPQLAQILSVISVTGILENLSGAGLYFDQLDSSIRFSGNDLAIGHMRLVGTSLGLSLRGHIDMERDRVNLDGTVAPMNILNLIADNTILGSILTGTRGEGIIAPQYRVSGAASNPSVTVQPLTTLMPGVLREIFTGGQQAYTSRRMQQQRSMVPSGGMTRGSQ